MPNPSAPPLDIALPRFRSATVRSFDAATWTATIQVTGSLASYLESVPVAKTLNAQLLTAGAKVGAVFFDDSNPTDAAVVAVYGAVPAAYVTSDMIVNGTIATADIADLAVTTGKLADLAVTTGKINDLGVTTGKINDLAVTTGKINDLAVTSGKLAANAVIEAKINDGAVTLYKIGVAAVNATRCLANQANGVATIDSAGDMSPPGDIFAVGDFYPTNQTLSKFYWDGSYLAANNNFKVYGGFLATSTIYPSGQTTRGLYDDGTYTAVTAGFKAYGDLLTTGNLVATGELRTSSGIVATIGSETTVNGSGGTMDVAIGQAYAGLLLFQYRRTNNSERTGAAVVLVSAGATGDTRVSVISQVNDGVITNPGFAANGDNLRFTNNDGTNFYVRYLFMRA